jgi:hypothetical protein
VRNLFAFLLVYEGKSRENCRLCEVYKRHTLFL